VPLKRQMFDWLGRSSGSTRRHRGPDGAGQPGRLAGAARYGRASAAQFGRQDPRRGGVRCHGRERLHLLRHPGRATRLRVPQDPGKTGREPGRRSGHRRRPRLLRRAAISSCWTAGRTHPLRRRDIYRPRSAAPGHAPVRGGRGVIAPRIPSGQSVLAVVKPVPEAEPGAALAEETARLLRRGTASQAAAPDRVRHRVPPDRVGKLKRQVAARRVCEGRCR